MIDNMDSLLFSIAHRMDGLAPDFLDDEDTDDDLDDDLDDDEDFDGHETDW